MISKETSINCFNKNKQEPVNVKTTTLGHNDNNMCM